ARPEARNEKKPRRTAGEQGRPDPPAVPARQWLTQPRGPTLDQSGQMDMAQLLAAQQQSRQELMSARQELADTEVEGAAGGGLVTATVNGQGELVDLTISAAAIDATDPADTAQSVADLVLAAVRDACRAAGELQQE